MAVKVCVVPSAIDGLAGVTAMETSAAALTIRVGVTVAAIVPWVALIVALRPTAALVVRARPGVVVLKLMPEVDGVALQVTIAVRFWVELSVKVPVAANCCDFPAAIEMFPAGVIAIDTKAAAVTVKVKGVGGVTPERLALMLGEPGERAVMSPAVTEALAVLEVQVARVVMSPVLPSL